MNFTPPAKRRVSNRENEHEFTAGIHPSGPSIAWLLSWLLNRRCDEDHPTDREPSRRSSRDSGYAGGSKSRVHCRRQFWLRFQFRGAAVELSFACLEWDDAVAICRKIKKLAAALPPAGLLAQPSPGGISTHQVDGQASV